MKYLQLKYFEYAGGFMENISFIGGDKRNLYLSRLYEKEANIYTYLLNGKSEDFKLCLDMSQYIVLPIPFSMDGINIYSPLSSENLSIEDLIKSIKKKNIICGGMKQEYADLLKQNNNTIIDIMQYESLSINNAIPTAEGIIKIIIENTEITINNSNIAIIGFGRVGKKAAELLANLNAKIHAYDIKKDEVANIRLSGYNVLEDIDRSLAEMDVIINTVPQKIITKNNLEHIDRGYENIESRFRALGADIERVTE